MSIQTRRAQILLTVQSDGRIQTQLNGQLSPAEVVFALVNLTNKLVSGEFGQGIQLPSVDELKRRMRG